MTRFAAVGLALVGSAMAMSPAMATTKPASAAKPAVAAKPGAMPKPSANGDVTRARMIAEVKQVFQRADTNHDGFMSKAEFAARMGIILNETPPGSPGAPSAAQAQRMLDAANRAFAAVDRNHDGKLSLAEATYRPLKVFDEMDANHDGVLTLAEKRAAHAQGEQSPVGPSPDGPPAADQPGR